MAETIEYMTDLWGHWGDAMKEAEGLSEDGWKVVAVVERDEHVRLVLSREKPDELQQRKPRWWDKTDGS